MQALNFKLLWFLKKNNVSLCFPSRDNSNKGQRVYEKKKDADWQAEEADLLATALQLIATGAVPEEEEEEPEFKAKEKKTRRVPGQIVEGRMEVLFLLLFILLFIDSLFIVG